jgi:hypothetical protein
MKITDDYYVEKVEAYNVAIQALEMHESDSDRPGARLVRHALAEKLGREINRWMQKFDTGELSISTTVATGAAKHG